MKLFPLLLTVFLLPLLGNASIVDSVPLPLGQRKASQFIQETEAKAAKYARRIANRTEKALAKLARWEGKVKTLLEKASPGTAQRLFADNTMTFARLLEQYQSGQAIANRYGTVYDGYRDRLQGTMQYLSAQNNKAKGAQQQLRQLDSLVNNTEALQRFVKERKRQLAEQCIQYIGKSRYLQKIDKESYYYTETLRNYRELFNGPQKVETLAMKVLQKVPGFENFLQRNSAVAGLFGFNASAAGNGPPNLSGLQTRAGMQNLLQQQFGSGATATLQNNVQDAQSQLARLKDRVAQGGKGGNDELPGFKPNHQKAKTFWQRIEYTANIGFGKLNPIGAVAGSRGSGGAIGTADLALGIGYKLNDKSTIGIAAGYKLGLGNWQRIRLSGHGMGLRSYIDWRLKKQFYISGGYEINHVPTAASTDILMPDTWQRSALIGISKKMKIKSKWVKGSSVQLLYNLLYRQQRPEGQPFVFRIGYSFK